MLMDMDEDITYRRLLATIDGELHEDDIRSLRFLCEPYTGTKKSSSNFTSGFDIFYALEKNNKLSESKMDYLCELLYTIGRIDLATLIDPEYDCACNTCMFVDPFRVMLFKLSEELASEDLTRLRYLYGKVPRKLVIADGIDLLSLMLQHKTVAPQHLDPLKSMLLEIDRHDLVETINNFNGDNSQGHQELSHSISCTEVPAVLQSPGIDDMQKKHIFNISGKENSPDLCHGHFNQLDSISENDLHDWEMNSSDEDITNQISKCKLQELTGEEENIPVSLEPAQAVAHPDALPETAIAAAVPNQLPSMISLNMDDGYIPIEYYKMTAVPRGICIIIDNQKFTPDLNDPEAITNLGNREGSDKDSEALKNSFERLKFLVKVKTDLKDVEIIQVLKNISAQDHTKYDCLVCCILSHGGESHVFGVNGRKVQLGSITSMFRAQSCPSLARKPKLFFMASCRGKNHQTAVQEPEPLFDTDRPEIDFDSAEWVPNEADFLFGYSTVVNHVSYRSRSQGTFYVRELTNILDKYAHREDLQTLLVRVNAAVSEKIYSREESTGFMVYKQTPAPQHTLRKHLKFL